MDGVCMEEVKIENSRATRFVSMLVKLTAFVSFLLFVLTFYIYKYRAGNIYKRQVAICDAVLSQGLANNSTRENFIQRLFTGAKSNCFERASRTVGVWAKISFIALDVSILLPLVYFGGGKLMKDTTEKIIKRDTLTSGPQPLE
ncbi:hypothetical protein A3E41_04790 [Candidatus Woesebacteria bacterium RIFCSPHIGHO2_12_FULL_38_9]|nr:MAG: hypothetical protein A3E41_04790 [Candidatus Woesebacteria bacterium RIFCSPHIGHO2_12_FULL_38_9]